MDIDIESLNDADLAALQAVVWGEVDRRRIIATAPQAAEALREQYVQAVGRADMQEYRQPTGAHDAYGEGDRVVLNGTVYRSLVAGNVWAPPGDTWEAEGTGEASAAPAAPAWAVGTAYSAGDRITYQEQVYIVAQAHTSAAHWPPDQVRSLYSPE